MRIYSSLWEADDWATCGGRVKTDWTKAPFVASFRNFNVNACAWSYGASSCKSKSGFADSISNSWIWEELDVGREGQMKWVRDNYMTYDYCKDSKRFPHGLPRECYVTNFPWTNPEIKNWLMMKNEIHILIFTYIVQLLIFIGFDNSVFHVYLSISLFLVIKTYDHTIFFYI